VFSHCVYGWHGCRVGFLLSADLERSTEYNVRVQAMTVNGSGPPTPWISVQTFAHDLDGKAAHCSQVLLLTKCHSICANYLQKFVSFCKVAVAVAVAAFFCHDYLLSVYLLLHVFVWQNEISSSYTLLNFCIFTYLAACNKNCSCLAEKGTTTTTNFICQKHKHNIRKIKII